MPLLDSLLAIIAPHHCLNCGSESSLLCDWCLPEVRSPLPSRCFRCRALTADFAVCDKCRKQTVLKHVWVATEYNEMAKELIQQFKFNYTRAAAKPVARLMSEVLPFFTRKIIVVHVPTATSRRRQRGFDQSELLARELARSLRLSQATLLARLGQSRQVGATREQRLQQLINGFHPRKPYLIKGAHILLVDDITTTGATLEAAARVLKQAGAKHIDAVVFAQKL